MAREWQDISTAPRDGTVVECRWSGYGGPQVHEGRCVYKRDWYALGKPVELELWWTGDNFKNPTAKDPTHWRPVETTLAESLKTEDEALRRRAVHHTRPKGPLSLEQALDLSKRMESGT